MTTNGKIGTTATILLTACLAATKLGGAIEVVAIIIAFPLAIVSLVTIAIGAFEMRAGR